jgi:hypothetical protein
MIAGAGLKRERKGRKAREARRQPARRTSAGSAADRREAAACGAPENPRIRAMLVNPEV